MFLILKETKIIDIVNSAEIQQNGILCIKDSIDIFYADNSLTVQEVIEVPSWVELNDIKDIEYIDNEFICTRCIYINQMELRRHLGTAAKINIDNYDSFIDNTEITEEEKIQRKMIVKSILKDFESSNEFWSNDSDFQTGIGILYQYGFITQEKMNELLCIY
jgi:hypothetical protein